MNIRPIVLATGEIYHVFNRGVERRVVFTNKFEYSRALDTINYYRFSQLPLRYSHFMELNDKRKEQVLDSLDDTEVTIMAYCLMPNHFHFILKQGRENGISRFVGNFTNSYNRYFNIKNDRVGPLFQGTFKAVRVETDEQLIHLSRYVHLNPVSSFIIKESVLDSYPWSSLPEYLGDTIRSIAEPKVILDQFESRKNYHKFVHDYINYQNTQEIINEFTFDDT